MTNNDLAPAACQAPHLDGALDAASRGWLVFPLWAKGGPIKGWQAAATTDIATIAAWAQRYPGFAIMCGRESGLFVVDDDREKHDLDPYTPAEPLPETLRAQGQSGKGMRHFYAWPADDAPVPNSVGKLAPHVDIKGQGAGGSEGDGNGYVVCWGSFGGRLMHDALLAEPPAWLLAAARAGRASSAGAIDVDALPLRPLDRERLIAAWKWLAEQAPAVAGQGGHSQTLAVAARLVTLFAVEPDALRVLMVHYSARCEPPWSDAELDHKVSEAYRSEIVRDWAESLALTQGVPGPANDTGQQARGAAHDYPAIVLARGRYFARKLDPSDPDDSLDYRFTASSDRALAIMFKPRGSMALPPPILTTAIEAALDTRADYRSERTLYDLESRTLTIGARTYGEARFDPDVAAWLAALAGDKLEGLTQQIAACAPRWLGATSRATAIIGPKSTGKTLLAHGLARVWQRLPVPMRLAISRFNGALERCPIVLADEALPADLTGEMFRELLGSHGRDIELKGKEVHSVDGCLRVILAIQDEDRLVLRGRKSRDDVEAIATRLFIVRVPGDGQAERALRPLLDESGSVADLDRIAGHFRWIWENVEPVKGRFLGAAEDGESLAQVLRGEVERARGLWELIGAFLAEPAVWAEGYAAGPHAEACKATAVRGRAQDWGRQAAPLLLEDDRLLVYPNALALALGWELEAVNDALRPFKVGGRAVRWLLGRTWSGHALDLARVRVATQ